MQAAKIRAGQAMVELAVGLLAMMALLGALIQIGRLAHARSRTMMEARAAAGALGLADTNMAGIIAGEYIYNWHVGRDSHAYTRDDVPLTANGDAEAVQAAVTASGMAGAPAPPINPFRHLAAVVYPGRDFALVHSAESESVDVLPIVRRLVYDDDTIVVSSRAWMVWMGGIY
ncbi:MAG: TadE/TadG family type IV pilus assembly protein [Kiritimatiellia bacterium]|jgi:hypothetical protein